MRYVCDGVITQGFSTAHPALDMAFNGGGSASYGKPLYAPEAGRVTYVGQKGSGVTDAGIVVQISTLNRVHRICHMIPGSPTVSVGQMVSEGQHIGSMGWSGYVIPANFEGTHVHWVMEIDGARVDPRKYITTQSNVNGGSAVDTIKSMYLRLLGREADQAGINHYTGVAGSKGWQFVYTDLKNSEEGQRDWDRRNPARVAALEAKEAEALALRAQVAQLEQALRNEQNKPPREVVKEVEKIVTQTVEVVKEVPVYTHDQETKDTVNAIHKLLKSVWGSLTSLHKKVK